MTVPKIPLRPWKIEDVGGAWALLGADDSLILWIDDDEDWEDAGGKEPFIFDDDQREALFDFLLAAVNSINKGDNDV